jgi:predicted DNA-binding transcriptional regulator AlpA
MVGGRSVIVTDETSNEWERLLTTGEAARVLGISARTLSDWRWKRISPPFISLSRNAVRYRHRDLIEWAEKQKRCARLGGALISTTDQTTKDR